MSLVCWCCSAKTVSHQILPTRVSEIQMSPFAVIDHEGLCILNQSKPCCRMCSWHDDISGFHSKGTDDWCINEDDLKDLTMNKITVDHTVQGITEISHLQHNDNMVNISVGEIVRVPQVQVMMETDRDPTITARFSQILTSDKTEETFASSQHHHSIWSQLHDRFPPSL